MTEAQSSQARGQSALRSQDVERKQGQIINNKYVILSEYESDYLVVKYDDTNETTIFFTSEYQLVNKENLNIKPLSFPNIEYK